MSHDRIMEVKAATAQRFTGLWWHNFLANRERIARSPSALALKNKLKGMPCVAIGAGPSLDKNLRYLPHARDRALLIACDAALKVLLRHEVTPQFVVCLDPQEEIARFLAGVPQRGITLIAPTIVHPQVLHLWEGDVLFYHKYAPDIPVLVEIQAQMPEVGVLTPGGSVLSIAYDFAFQIGGNPVLFVGQDLSYSKKSIYGRKDEDAGENLYTVMAKQPENVVPEMDIYGYETATHKSMSVSKQWFNWAFSTWRREHPLTVYNCSEAGILAGHCQQATLREGLLRHCPPQRNISWAVKKALR